MKPPEREEGRYWVALLPDGDHAVMYTQTAFPKWHKQVATFADPERARDYAKMENSSFGRDDERERPPTKLPLTLTPSKSEPEPTLKLKGEALVERIKADLPALFAEFPRGATARVLSARYGSPYSDIVAAARYLHAFKVVRWVSPDGAPRKFLLPLTPNEPEPDLTKAQERALKVMADMKDGNSLISMTPLELSSLALLDRANVPSVLSALERKGYIMLAKPGDQKNPATYQVLIPEPRQTA